MYYNFAFFIWYITWHAILRQSCTSIILVTSFFFLKCVQGLEPGVKYLTYLSRGALNKKEIQLNLCNILSIFIFNELYLFASWLFNCVKQGRAVTFMKYLTSVVSLIFLPKTLIWNKTTFPASNSLNLAELVVNELMKSIYKKLYQYFFFYLIYHCLM